MVVIVGVSGVFGVFGSSQAVGSCEQIMLPGLRPLHALSKHANDAALLILVLSLSFRSFRVLVTSRNGQY